MKKRLIALIMLCCLVLTGCGVNRETEIPDAPAATDTLEATDAPAHADAYLLVTVADDVYQPIPLTEAGRYTITRGDHVNVVEVTADSVRMAESTCDNQDCVYQGTVTLENKDERVLQNMILCIPNEVILQLYTYEELKLALPGWEAQ